MNLFSPFGLAYVWLPMRIRLAIFAAFGLMLPSAATLFAEEEPASPERPLVTQVGDHAYRIGEIRFDSKTREVRIPVVVNMREGGPMEYLLVHESGKVHESVFVTRVSALHLQIALKLLKYESGHGDVFNRMLPPHLIEEEGGKRADRGESVNLAFIADSTDTEVPAGELILDGDSMEPLSDPGWIHTGSEIREGNFMAEVEGGFVAIYLDPNAMFNMTRDGADIDERWGANDKKIPKIGTKGELVIRLATS